MKLKSIGLFILLVCAGSSLRAQSTEYLKRTHLLYQAVYHNLRDSTAGLYYETTDSAKNENKHSWLWPLCALIQAANEMEAVEPGKIYMLPVEKAIDKYYSDAPPVPAYQDYVLSERKSSRFYDDNEWIAIAYLDAYNRNHKQKYLKTAEMIYRFIQSGTDTVAGGGVYWKEGDLKTKNTCSNGPAVLIALQLYKITHQAQYLNDAMAVYSWTNKHLQTPEGLYYDNIKLPSLTIGRALFTYNTGTMLQANVLLYNITKNSKYLTEARRIAKAGRAQFFVNGRLPNGEYWFNAVMLRGYEALYQAEPDPAWIDFYADDSNNIWASERDTANLVGPKNTKRLIDQAAMMEIYARLERLQLNKRQAGSKGTR